MAVPDRSTVSSSLARPLGTSLDVMMRQQSGCVNTMLLLQILSSIGLTVAGLSAIGTFCAYQILSVCPKTTCAPLAEDFTIAAAVCALISLFFCLLGLYEKKIAKCLCPEGNEGAYIRL